MPSRTRQPFFLDGGYDRDEVEACVYHPRHHWIVLRMGDVYDHWRDPEERHVVCRNCLVPRCGSVTDPNPCMLPRHHRELHLYENGTLEDATVWPGSDKSSPPGFG